MFTDIVGSTDQLAAVGDRAWRADLDRHDALVRECLAATGGREVDTAGDGFFAVFDGPARRGPLRRGDRRRCAATSASTSAPACTSVSARCAAIGYAGIAVHTGARIAALAGAGEVLASRTVKDLVAGSGIEFADHGVHELKGIPEPWQVYRVVWRSAAVAEEPVPRVERGGRVHRGHGEARQAGLAHERVGQPVGDRRAEAVARHGPHPGEAGESLHRPGERDLLRRVGRPDPFERLGVGLAVGAHAVDPHLVHGHRVAALDAVDDAGVAVERGRAPGTRCARSSSGAPASGSCSSSRSRPSSSAAVTGPARRRSSSAGSVSATAPRLSAPPGAAEGVDHVVERVARPVVVGAAPEHQRQVAQVGAQLHQLGVAVVGHDRRERLAVALHHHLGAVGGVGHQPGHAPAARLGHAHPLGLGHATRTVQKSAQTCRRNLDLPRAASYPAASTQTPSGSVFSCSCTGTHPAIHCSTVVSARPCPR